MEIDSPDGVAIDSSTGRIYWGNRTPGEDEIAFANLAGGGGGALDTGGPIVTEPEGVAIDPIDSRIYWANSGDNTLAYTSFIGGPKGLVETGAANTEYVNFPVLLKTPRTPRSPSSHPQPNRRNYVKGACPAMAER